MEQTDCIFCYIAQGKSPAQIEYQDNLVVVFWDIQPNAPVHLLVVPRKHIPTMREVTKDDSATLSVMLTTAAEIARRKGLEKGGYRLVFNTGPNAHQVVDHLHLHILGGGDLGPMTNAKPNPVSQYD